MEFIILIAVLWFLFKAIPAWLRTEATVANAPRKRMANAPSPSMGKLTLRGLEKDIEDKEHSLNYRSVELQVCGLFPVTGTRDCAFVTSVFDITDGGWVPVDATVHFFQEEETIRFQQVTKIGEAKENYGFAGWVKIGAVVLDLLQPPRQGSRKLKAIVRLIDTRQPPRIREGFNLDGAGGDEPNVLWRGTHAFTLVCEGPGYLDEAEEGLECAASTVKLAVAMAMADGELHDDEGKQIKHWIQKRLASSESNVRQNWKEVLNAAFRDGVKCHSDTLIDHSIISEHIFEVGSTSDHMECVDLLFAIAGSDGKINSKEMAFAKSVADTLDIDADELRKLTDRSLLGVEIDIDHATSIGDLLGIEPHWDADRTKRHLREQFQRWNNRLTSFSDAGERENAQRMLDCIAEARKKYN